MLARQMSEASEEAAEMWLPFDVENSTSALLVLSAEDEYGRLMSVDSYQVELLPGGEPDLVAVEAQPAIEFSAPQDGMRIDGASVRVYAFVDSEDGRAFNIRLVTREGRVVANRDVYSEDGVVQAEVLANMNETAFVRVVVSRTVSGVIVELNSAEVELILD